MEPLTCTLPAAVVAAAGRVEAARERAGKAEKMLASASSLPQVRPHPHSQHHPDP
eukprot:COSAG04_NODE_254_length_18809_cov_8.025869_28_plen_55_part_00